MTDRYNALVVVLERDIRSDDAEDIISALRMVKGVSSVTPNVSSLQDHIARARARTELAEKLWAVLQEAKP